MTVRYVQPVYPLLLATALLSALLALRRNHARARRLCLASAAALLLWSWPPVHWLAAFPFEAPYRGALPPDKVTVDAIVVLSGGVQMGRDPLDNQPRATYATFVRCRYAARLYRLRWQVPIVASGGDDEANVMGRLLQGFGVPETMILRENRSRNTLQNAEFTAQILKKHNWQRIVLVTQAYHMPRAVWAFRHFGIDPLPAACDFATVQPIWNELLPDGSTIRRNELLAHEIGGFILYRTVTLFR